MFSNELKLNVSHVRRMFLGIKANKFVCTRI